MDVREKCTGKGVGTHCNDQEIVNETGEHPLTETRAVIRSCWTNVRSQTLFGREQANDPINGVPVEGTNKRKE